MPFGRRLKGDTCEVQLVQPLSFWRLHLDIGLTLCANNAIHATLWKKAWSDTNSANLHNHTINNAWSLISIVSIVCRYLFTVSRTCQFAQWCKIKKTPSWAGCLFLRDEPGNRGHWLTTNPLQITLFMDWRLIVDCFDWSTHWKMMQLQKV